MKRLATAILLASILLVSAPIVQAKGPAVDQNLSDGMTLIQLGEINLVKGYRYYVATISDWLRQLLDVVAVSKKSVAGGICEDQSHCPAGLACLNACANGQSECDALVKRCVSGPKQISVIGTYGACTTNDVCAKGTNCRRVCPAGVTCASTNLCLPDEPVSGACKTDDRCLAGCLATGLPPIGGLALRAQCETGYCYCRVEAISPNSPRVPCSDGQPTYACPNGTHPACTTGGRPTCLLAPEFGGHCQGDAECSKVGCANGLAPFCDTDTLCRCRGAREENVSCKNDSECGSIVCDGGQRKSCLAGACACATTTTLTCKTTAECSGADCPSGYATACVSGECACQRTVQAPVACSSVSQCGSVSCPAGYTKDCISNQCACTRTQ